MSASIFTRLSSLLGRGRSSGRKSSGTHRLGMRQNQSRKMVAMLSVMSSQQATMFPPGIQPCGPEPPASRLPFLEPPVSRTLFPDSPLLKPVAASTWFQREGKANKAAVKVINVGGMKAIEAMTIVFRLKVSSLLAV